MSPSKWVENQVVPLENFCYGHKLPKIAKFFLRLRGVIKAVVITLL